MSPEIVWAVLVSGSLGTCIGFLRGVREVEIRRERDALSTENQRLQEENTRLQRQAVQHITGGRPARLLRSAPDHQEGPQP